MRRGLPFAMLGVFLSVTPARAEPIPDYVLNKDFQNCVGSETSNKEKVAYCNCVRDTMKNGWSLDQYGDMVEQEMKSPNQAPPQLQAIAKACYDKATK